MHVNDTHGCIVIVGVRACGGNASKVMLYLGEYLVCSGEQTLNREVGSH
jgi:hypothetical protein